MYLKRHPVGVLYQNEIVTTPMRRNHVVDMTSCLRHVPAGQSLSVSLSLSETSGTWTRFSAFCFIFAPISLVLLYQILKKLCVHFYIYCRLFWNRRSGIEIKFLEL